MTRRRRGGSFSRNNATDPSDQLANPPLLLPSEWQMAVRKGHDLDIGDAVGRVVPRA
jgi:hypothetical protein